eukprot:TRINITY_DN3958_c0_g1_i1.p1 TRINITY_DN3958_c0_g1~~TRINITY_DN3958_c0_g1_i1.p1  ORF type:complete len:321 (+),score=59.38 TRINITY_DN3958_c0_g1_i1:35-964(+)
MTKNEKRKKTPASNTAILSCSRNEQVVELAKALLREYMHKRGYSRTLKAYDEEDPRTEYSISSRALMADMMLLKGKSKSSIMEDIGTRKIEKKGVMQRMAELDVEIEQLNQKVDAVNGKLKAVKKKKKKKEEKQQKKPKRANSAPPSMWVPPAPASIDEQSSEPVFNSSIGIGYKSNKGPVLFGGRDWIPPPIDSTSAETTGGSEGWASNKILTGTEFKDLREKMRNEVEEERTRVGRVTSGHHVTLAPTAVSTGHGLPRGNTKLDKTALRLTSPPTEVLSPTTSALRPASLEPGSATKRDKRVSFAEK